ncbi:hypothetical protein AAHB37_12320 [Glutamicibacter halophytocola]|uniref:hypothetical protein n=1 Tax=Glutamicibacter halophytocola TaxID=1933880 RepID=UPI003219F779
MAQIIFSWVEWNRHKDEDNWWKGRGKKMGRAIKGLFEGPASSSLAGGRRLGAETPIGRFQIRTLSIQKGETLDGGEDKAHNEGWIASENQSSLSP